MKTVLSSRKMKSRAALIDISMEDAAQVAGLGVGYIYRIGGKDSMSLNTIGRIAKALRCEVCDILEDVTEDGSTETKNEKRKTARGASRLRDAKVEELIEHLPALPVDSDAIAKEKERRAMLIAQAVERGGSNA